MHQPSANRKQSFNSNARETATENHLQLFSFQICKAEGKPQPVTPVQSCKVYQPHPVTQLWRAHVHNVCACVAYNLGFLTLLQLVKKVWWVHVAGSTARGVWRTVSYFCCRVNHRVQKLEKGRGRSSLRYLCWSTLLCIALQYTTKWRFRTKRWSWNCVTCESHFCYADLDHVST